MRTMVVAGGGGRIGYGVGGATGLVLAGRMGLLMRHQVTLEGKFQTAFASDGFST